MSAADMQIVVSGDTSGANSALTALQGNLEKTAAASKETGSEFQVLQRQLSRFQTAASSTLNPELLTIYNAKVKELEGSMTALAQKEQLARIEAQNSAVKFEEMSVAVNNTSVGAQRLQSAISRATDPLQIAAREVNNFSRRLLYMVGAGVMGLAISAFEALLPSLEEFANKLFGGGEAAKVAADNIKNMSDIMEDASKHAGEQIADLKILYNAATNVNLSMKDRLAAVKELQKEFPDYFGNLSQETILTGKAAGAYNTLTQAILANARAKAAADKLEGLQSQQIDIDTAIAKANDKFKEAVRNIKGEITSSSGSSSFGATGTDTKVSVADQVAGFRLALERELEPLHLAGERLAKEKKYITDQFGDAALAKAIEKANTGKGTKEKKTNPYEIDLEKLKQQLVAAQTQEHKYYGANLEDAKRNTTDINDFLLTAHENYLIAKRALDKKYGKPTSEDDSDINKDIQKLEDLKTAFKQSQVLQDMKPDKLPKSEDPNYLATEKIGDVPRLQLSDEVIKKHEALDKIQQQLEATGQILQKTLLPAFDALFTRIIDGGRKSGESLSKMFGNIIKQIELTFVKAVALAAIMSFFGGSTFGAALDKNLGFTNVFTPHAAGTTYAQGGISLVGEHGPELVNLPRGASVTPNGQLNAISGNNNVFIPSLTLRGQDMIVAFNRANASANRNG